jgi:hypothetical protein
MHLNKDSVRRPLRIEAAPLVRSCAFPQFWRQRIATAARPDCFDDPFPPVFDPFGMVIMQRDPIRELRRLDLFAEERRIEVEAHKLLVFGVAAGSPLGVGKRAVITGNTLGQVRDRWRTVIRLSDIRAANSRAHTRSKAPSNGRLSHSPMKKTRWRSWGTPKSAAVKVTTAVRS